MRCKQNVKKIKSWENYFTFSQLLIEWFFCGTENGSSMASLEEAFIFKSEEPMMCHLQSNQKPFRHQISFLIYIYIY